ncbi:hypothetical protein [Frankia sp. Cr2]|uniref:hypothetical protein n=1 Tax=Frankia sp. Cr2 TaxID=3073932 RepID=UPI002AD1FF1D|nr:hypothetical protein [Frankia sp. Cr2]
MPVMIWTSDSLHVFYGQYYLCDARVIPDQETLLKVHDENSLIKAGPGHLVVLCGTHTGNVRLTVILCPAEPALGLDAWDAVVDLSHYSAEGDTWLTEWGGEPRWDAGLLSHTGPGWYRLRLEVRGRDEAMKFNTVLGEPVEEHAISIWPAPPAPEQVHKMADDFGRRHWDSSRPPAPPVYPEAGS